MAWLDKYLGNPPDEEAEEKADDEDQKSETDSSSQDAQENAFGNYYDDSVSREERYVLTHVPKGTIVLSDLEPPRKKSRVRWWHVLITSFSFLVLLYITERLGDVIAQVGQPYRVQPPHSYIGFIYYMITNHFLMFAIMFFVSAGLSWLIFSKLVNPKEKKDIRMKISSDDSSMGPAKWMSWREIEMRFNVCSSDDIDGIPLGKRDDYVICKPWTPKNYDVALNDNILVSGPPGKRKSRGLIVPTIMEIIKKGYSGLITDSKGDIYKKTIVPAIKHGYKIQIIDARAQKFMHSNGCDILKNVRESNDPVAAAKLFADVLIDNTEDPNTNNPEFWKKQDKNLTQGLVLYVTKSELFPREKPRTLRSFYELFQGGFDNLAKIVTDLNTSKKDDLAFPSLRNWARNSQAEQVYSNLATRLSYFQNDYILEMLSTDEIDYTSLGREKCLFYVVMDDQVSSYEFISSLFLRFLFYELVKFADDECGGTLPNKVFAVLDEFPNTGRIPDFKNVASTIRSRGVGLMVTIQGLTQLQELYPNGEWETIVNDCDTQICLGANDNTTARFFSDQFGDATVELLQKMKNISVFNPFHFAPMARESVNKFKRRILLPEEIRGMPVYEQVVYTSGTTSILEEYKYDYTEHPFSKLKIKRDGKTIDLKVDDYYPLWLREMYAEGRIPKEYNFTLPDDESDILFTLQQKQKKDSSYHRYSACSFRKSGDFSSSVKPGAENRANKAPTESLEKNGGSERSDLKEEYINREAVYVDKDTSEIIDPADSSAGKRNSTGSPAFGSLKKEASSNIIDQAHRDDQEEKDWKNYMESLRTLDLKNADADIDQIHESRGGGQTQQSENGSQEQKDYEEYEEADEEFEEDYQDDEDLIL